MGLHSRKRNEAATAADRLRVTLKGQLEKTSDDKLRESVIKAIGVVNQFLYSGDSTDEGLSVLKGKVAKILANPNPPSPRKAKPLRNPSSRNLSKTAPQPRTSSGPAKSAAPLAVAAGATGPVKKPGGGRGGGGVGSTGLPEVDWTLPPIAAQRKLQLEGIHNEYRTMAQHYDDLHITEDRRRKEAIKRKQAEVRADLQAQMDARRRAKEAEAEAKRRMGEELRQMQVKYEEDEFNRMVANYEKESRSKRERELQIRDQEDRARAAKETAMAADRQLMDQVQAEARRAEERKKVAAAADRERLRVTQEENVRNRQAKIQAKLDEKDADEALMKRYIEIEEARAQAREDEIEARRAKQLAMFKQGGGDALQASLAEKAAEDERKMLRVMREQEERAAAAELAKREKKRRDEATIRSDLAVQMNERALRAARDKDAKDAARAEMAEIVRLNKEAEAEAKRKLKAKKQALMDDQVNQIKLEAKHRFYEAGDFMPDRERKINNNIFGMQVVGAAVVGGGEGDRC